MHRLVLAVASEIFVAFSVSLVRDSNKCPIIQPMDSFDVAVYRFTIFVLGEGKHLTDLIKSQFRNVPMSGFRVLSKQSANPQHTVFLRSDGHISVFSDGHGRIVSKICIMGDFEDFDGVPYAACIGFVQLHDNDTTIAAASMLFFPTAIAFAKCQQIKLTLNVVDSPNTFKALGVALELEFCAAFAVDGELFTDISVSVKIDLLDDGVITLQLVMKDRLPDNVIGFPIVEKSLIARFVSSLAFRITIAFILFISTFQINVESVEGPRIVHDRVRHVAVNDHGRSFVGSLVCVEQGSKGGFVSQLESTFRVTAIVARPNHVGVAITQR
mmetsp:Transcript_1940/g.4244  ORF Transcript_1940/g.4244 Transcript_1940/m.4244 type:complete len:327 (-) Transcript_1940:415-1395(-)